MAGRNSRAAADADAQAEAQAQAQADADAAAQALADALAAEGAGDTPEPTPTPTPDPTPTPVVSGRRAAAEGALARSTQATKALVLAQGLAWHAIPGVGKCGVTVEQDAQGRTREYLTWVPTVGRTQKIPTYGVFPALDAGDLD
jgi:hypothetical protein